MSTMSEVFLHFFLTGMPLKSHENSCNPPRNLTFIVNLILVTLLSSAQLHKLKDVIILVVFLHGNPIVATNFAQSHHNFNYIFVHHRYPVPCDNHEE